MKYQTIITSLAFLVCMQGAHAQSFNVAVNSGTALVFQTKTGGRAPLPSSSTISMGDSVILNTGSQVTIGIETNSRLIFRGPGILAITGDSSAAYLSFDNGQVFLDRMEPATFSVLTFWVKNYMFVPVGTAAAIKVMGNGMPAVAVIEGRVLMQSPSGESVEIPAGSSGSVDAAGRIASGSLGKKVVASLEKWSGVKAKGNINEGKDASSSAAIDQEFGTIGNDAALSAPQGAPQKRVQAQAPAPTPAAETTAPSSGEPSASAPAAEQQGDAGEKKETAGAPAGGGSPTFEMSAGAVTVDDKQWTRIALGIDVPIWKFGVFFDVEAFLDQQGKFSKKGWDFEDNTFEAITRKIRYIRFGHEQDPLFVKVGGLSNVTFGYGFIMDRFTNMLHYPDQKLIGAQFYLNNVSPLGITLQVMGADFSEMRTRYEGGLGAARLAVRPFKTLGYPIIGNLSIGGTYAYDRNTYAPARDWKLSADEQLIQSAYDAGILPDPGVSAWLGSNGYDVDALTSQIAAENAAKQRKTPFGIYGVDLGLPLISSSLLSLDLYAQSGVRADSIQGWGFGAPGVALKVWRLSARLEYRHTQGRFLPGFFGPYYLDERLERSPMIRTKADALADDTLNGLFGRLGFDVANVLVVDGSYQYLTGSTAENKDHRFEISGGIGSVVLNKIPKIKKLEVYMYKTNIGSDIVKYDSTGVPVLSNGKPTYDGFFEKTPYLYYGYRLGFEITSGATLICDNRFGYERDAQGKLTPNNNIIVQTAFSF